MIRIRKRLTDMLDFFQSYSGLGGKILRIKATEDGIEAVEAATGDVTGPASATAGNFVLYDGTTGKKIKDGSIKPADFATAAQGALADTAIQPGDDASLTSLSTPLVVMRNAQDTNIATGITLSSTHFSLVTSAYIAGDLDSRNAITVHHDGYRPHAVIDGWLGVGITPTQAVEVVGTVKATSFSGSGSNLTGIALADHTHSGVYSANDHNHSGTYQPLDTQLTALAGLSYTDNGGKYIRVTAGADGFELATVEAGGGSGYLDGGTTYNEIYGSALIDGGTA